MLMITIRRAFRILGVRETRTINISMLAALIGVLGLAILVGSLYPHDRVALAAPHASKYEPWLEIDCLETRVEEGDDFRLVVNKKFDSEWPHKTMKVWWYTHPITADETDYERLHQERQASNGYQSKHGRMGRTFHTLEDNYPEIDETFTVEFLNAVSKGHDGECIITITDDDGVGIYDLEITSVPHQLPASDGQQPQVGYAEGDVIEITAYFTGDVTAVNPGTGEQSDYAGIYLQVGDRALPAQLRRQRPGVRLHGAGRRPGHQRHQRLRRRPRRRSWLQPEQTLRRHLDRRNRQHPNQSPLPRVGRRPRPPGVPGEDRRARDHAARGTHSGSSRHHPPGASDGPGDGKLHIGWRRLLQHRAR